MSPRDHERELELLAPGGAAYTEAVAERLDVGDQRYGDRWATRALEELLRETREDAQDIGARGVLAVQATDHADLTASDRASVVRRVKRAIALAARADAELHAALDIATLQPTDTPQSASERVTELLRVHLPRGGWHLAASVKEAVAAGAPASLRTVERAARALGVESRRISEPHARVVWRWPTHVKSLPTTGICRCGHAWPSEDGRCFRCGRAIRQFTRDNINGPARAAA